MKKISSVARRGQCGVQVFFSCWLSRLVRCLLFPPPPLRKRNSMLRWFEYLLARRRSRVIVCSLLTTEYASSGTWLGSAKPCVFHKSTT